MKTATRKKQETTNLSNGNCNKKETRDKIYYCSNVAILIIKKEHFIVWNTRHLFDFLKMISLMGPTGEYFLKCLKHLS